MGAQATNHSLAHFTGVQTVPREELPRCTWPSGGAGIQTHTLSMRLQLFPLSGGLRERLWLTLVLSGAKVSWPVRWGIWEGGSKCLWISLPVK